MIPYFTLNSFQLSFLTIRVWGLMVSLGFITGLLILRKINKIQKLDWDKLLNLVLGILILSFFFARLFFVFFGGVWDFFQQNPLKILAFWDGGFSSAGGFFGAGLFLWLFYKKNKDNFWKYADALALTFPFGWIIGRLGCFFIHDHPGKLTNFFLAVKFPAGTRLDIGFLEVLAILPLAISFFVMVRRKAIKSPSNLPIYVIFLLLWYGIARFFLDFLRAQDLPFSDPRFLGLTIAQWGSFVLIFLGLKILIKRKVRIVV